jgi:transcriptional regulator with XRE-family HTH domain
MPDSKQDRAELGERLRQAREYLELSQDEVAKKLNIPRSAVSLVESGQRKVDAIELRRFAELYQRAVGYFTGEVVGAPIPEDVEHLARAARKLSGRDRQELARFAEFLSSRAASRIQDGE